MKIFLLEEFIARYIFLSSVKLVSSVWLEFAVTRNLKWTRKTERASHYASQIRLNTECLFHTLATRCWAASPISQYPFKVFLGRGFPRLNGSYKVVIHSWILFFDVNILKQNKEEKELETITVKWKYQSFLYLIQFILFFIYTCTSKSFQTKNKKNNKHSFGRCESHVPVLTIRSNPSLLGPVQKSSCCRTELNSAIKLDVSMTEARSPNESNFCSTSPAVLHDSGTAAIQTSCSCRAKQNSWITAELRCLEGPPRAITRNLRHFTPVVLLVSGVFKYQYTCSSASDFMKTWSLGSDLMIESITRS